jgi:hypothetical protein
MGNTSESTRPNYAVDRLGMIEMGPMSMANILIDHLEDTPKKPIMMIGEPGIGKTAVTYQLENSNKYHVLTIRLVNEDEGTMNGYADPDKDGQTVTLRVVRKVVEAAEAAKEAGKRLIVFFDEVNRAKDHMIKYVFNIIDTRRWGDYMLPADTGFISAINPPTKNHKVRDILSDSALRRRFSVYAMKADAAEYIQYAKEANIHPAVISFIKSKPKYIYDYVSLDNEKFYACPASWDYISDIVYKYQNKGGLLENISRNHSVSVRISASIGEAMTYEFLTHAEDMTKKYSPENILDSYSDIQDEIQECVNSEFTVEDAALDLGKLATIVSTLAAFVADKIVNADMHFYVDDTTREEEGITKKDAVKYNKQGGNLAKFLADCPRDLFQAFFNTIRKEIDELVPSSNVNSHNYIRRTNELTNYKVYVDAANSYMEARRV